MIETSEEARGGNTPFSSTTSTRRGRKKDRSEPQRRHDLLLRKSRYDPLASIMLSGAALSRGCQIYDERVSILPTA